MSIIQFPQTSTIDNSLLPYFGWIGNQFPFVPISTANITISGATTWSDATGYKQVGKLTINAGQTLTIQKFPFYIFCNELAFGDAASIIDASGPSGTSACNAFNVAYSRGGTDASKYAQGGCGGGMLFIIAGKITGAAGVIRANGGNGWSHATSGGSGYKGGQGALSLTYDSSVCEQFTFAIGVADISGSAIQNSYNFSRSLKNILGTSTCAGAGGAGMGGGSGYGGSTGGYSSGGGSGIGSGGSAGSSNVLGGNGNPALITPTVLDLLLLAQMGCKGGGGGSYCSETSSKSNGGGGGGGSIVVWTHSANATPTLQANGGTGTSVASNVCNGGAGVTNFILL